MSLIKEMFKDKLVTVAAQKNLTNYQKKKRLGAFVNNVLYMIDIIQTRQNQKNSLTLNNEFVKNVTGEYSWVSMKQFEKKIKDRGLLQECKEYLKQQKLIDVMMKDGKEYYVHFAHSDLGYNICSKGYKLTEKCKHILSNTTTEEFDEFIKQLGIEELKKYSPETPKEVMQKVEDNYWFFNTKKNIEHVLENNLELEFHPTTVQELMDNYNAQRYFDGEKELSKEEIELEISHKLDEFANKDFSYNVRLYTAFTNIPRAWRKYVTTKDGKRVTELFDIHSSVLNILPLVCRIELLKNGCSKEVFEQFEAEEKMLELMLRKDVYTTIAAGDYCRQDIKDALMKVLFSNNKSFENVAKIELTGKGKTKKSAANRIRFWLKDNFPTMFNVLANFEQVEKKDEVKGYKKFKSQYWKAFQELETELMCELNRRVEKQFGIKVYNLHDGCFSEDSEPALYSDTSNLNMIEFCQEEYIKLKEELKACINQFYKVSAPVEDLKRIEKHLPVQEIKVEAPKAVYKAVEGKIVKEEPEEQIDIEALSAGLDGLL